MAISPVNLTDTFDVWRTRTNQLITLSGATTSNVSNVSNIATLAFTGANTANARAIAAFAQANNVAGAVTTANSYAVAAFTKANTVDTTATAAFGKANTVETIATSAFGKANTTDAIAVAAFGQANTANVRAVAAFSKANTVETIATAAFTQANTANVRAVSAFTKANTVETIATAAFSQANTANIRAVAAFEKANSSAIRINTDVVDATRYIAFTNNTTGNASTLNVSSTGLFFNPSSRTLTANNISIPVSIGVGTDASGAVGEIRATSDITAYYSSDISLKENINVIPDALNKLMNIRGVEFDWNQSYIEERGGEDGYFVRKRDVGIIAQEVEQILPEVVATRDNGIKAVKYEKLIALLVEAIKELNNKLEKK